MQEQPFDAADREAAKAISGMASALSDGVHPSFQDRTMRTRNLLAATAILAAFACTKSENNPADSLALAAKNQATLDSISAAERAAAPLTTTPAATAPVAAPATRTYTPARTTTRRSTSGTRSSTSSGPSTSGTSATTTTSAPAISRRARIPSCGGPPLTRWAT